MPDRFAFPKMSLARQILLSMTAVVLVVGLVAGEVVRNFETKRLTEDFQSQSDQIFSLLSGLMVETIIVQDVPLIESALKQAVERIPSLEQIQTRNQNGEVIGRFPRQPVDVSEHSVSFVKDVEFDGIVFGKMVIQWSKEAGLAKIQKTVFQARVLVAVILLVQTLLFLLITSKLVIRPLGFIYNRMDATLARKQQGDRVKGGATSKEFIALSDSVTTLDKILTERELKEEQLTIAREKADAASQSKSEFLANMSHEIRTPMNGVIGMAELMLETKMSRDQKVYAETISKSGAALLTIINDILDFSKIESGKMELDPAPFDMLGALEDVTTLVASKAMEKQVEVTLRYQPDLPVGFNGDVGRIRQVLTNIIGNAVKFTLDGHVLVAVSGVVEDGLTSICIAVEDTGIGIPPEKIAHIFEEFEQVDGAANRKFEGTGLGLAISNKLVGLMGGRIEVTSEMGQGSVFLIRFKLPTCELPADQNVQTDGDVGGQRVLIVDDLQVNRTILSERLRYWDVRTEVAASGKEALEILVKSKKEKQPFDLAILDFQMPDMDGLALAKRIRVQDSFKSLPLILLSSVDQSVDADIKLELGFQEILLKPVRSAVIKSALLATAAKTETKPKPKPRSKPTSALTGLPNGIPLKGLKILVAEDNKTNQLVLKTMLKKTGVVLEIAENGVEAVRAYQDFRPDLVLMDMSMPEMDGLQASREIRTIEKARELRRCAIIALTANAMENDRQNCLDAGMDDYLSKPIVRTRLTETLHKWSVLKHREAKSPTPAKKSQDRETTKTSPRIKAG